MKRVRVLVSAIVGLLYLVAGLLAGNARAQQSFPFESFPFVTTGTPATRTSRSSQSSVVLDREPKLRTKVWLVMPDSTIGRTLTELTARTMPLTHLKLQAQASVQPLPISCYMAGVTLRDVLDGLTVFSTLQWKHTAETGLLLGISDYVPGRRYIQPRIAYYGMRVIHELEQQPAKLRDMLKAGQVLLGSLPPPMQRAVQALLKVRADDPRGRNRPQLELPVDPKTTEVSLEEETYADETRYRLRVAGQQPLDDNSYDFNMSFFFSAAQAAEYQPDPRIDADPQDQGEAIGKDPRFELPVTLDVHAVTLSEALKSLFAATHIPLLAAGTEHPAHADVACKKVPLTEALNRICAAYGYRWERLDSGIVALLINRQ